MIILTHHQSLQQSALKGYLSEFHLKAQTDRPTENQTESSR